MSITIKCKCGRSKKPGSPFVCECEHLMRYGEVDKFSAHGGEGVLETVLARVQALFKREVTDPVLKLVKPVQAERATRSPGGGTRGTTEGSMEVTIPVEPPEFARLPKSRFKEEVIRDHMKGLAVDDAMRELAQRDFADLESKVKLSVEFDDFFAFNRSHYEGLVGIRPGPTLKFSAATVEDRARQVFKEYRFRGYLRDEYEDLFVEHYKAEEEMANV